MDRTSKEQYIIGSISLLSNKITLFADSLFPDITFRQWWLLLMISKMDTHDKNLNEIAEFVGTTRQNVKKMLVPLENKGYVTIEKSKLDARSLSVELTEKTMNYFIQNNEPTAIEANKLFSSFSKEEIDNLSNSLEKLLNSLETYGKEQ